MAFALKTLAISSFTFAVTANRFSAEGAPGRKADFDEQDPLFNFLETAWIVPCMSRVHPLLHGLCMYAPALLVAILVILLVSTLAWCEARDKKKKAAPPPPGSKTATAQKPKKTKKAD